MCKLFPLAGLIMVSMHIHLILQSAQTSLVEPQGLAKDLTDQRKGMSYFLAPMDFSNCCL